MRKSGQVDMKQLMSDASAEHRRGTERERDTDERERERERESAREREGECARGGKKPGTSRTRCLNPKP